MSRPPKARKISVFLAFPRFSAAVCFGKKLLTTDLTTYGFDSKNSISGCRVTVTHQFWELAQAGSTPVIPTKNKPKMRFFAPLSADFLLIIGLYPPLLENLLTAEKRLVPHLQHKPLSFFRKAFSLTTAAQFLRADRHGQPLFLFIKHELFVSPVEAAIYVFVIATPLKHNHIIGISFYCPRKTSLGHGAFSKLALLSWYFDIFRFI